MFSKYLYNVGVPPRCQCQARLVCTGPDIGSGGTLQSGRCFSGSLVTERDNAGYVAAVLTPTPKKNRVRKPHGLKAPRVEGRERRNPGNGVVLDPRNAGTSRSILPPAAASRIRQLDDRISVCDHRATGNTHQHLVRCLSIGSGEPAIAMYPLWEGNRGI